MPGRGGPNCGGKIPVPPQSTEKYGGDGRKKWPDLAKRHPRWATNCDYWHPWASSKIDFLGFFSFDPVRALDSWLTLRQSSRGDPGIMHSLQATPGLPRTRSTAELWAPMAPTPGLGRGNLPDPTQTSEQHLYVGIWLFETPSGLFALSTVPP